MSDLRQSRSAMTALLCVVESPADVHGGRAVRRLSRPVFRADGASVAAGRHRARGTRRRSSRRCWRQAAVREVILATNSTVEGEATAHLFSQLVRQHVASEPAASPMACRWAANSSTSTAARWRTRWPDARRRLTAPAGASAGRRSAWRPLPGSRRAAAAAAGSSRSAVRIIVAAVDGRAHRAAGFARCRQSAKRHCGCQRARFP